MSSDVVVRLVVYLLKSERIVACDTMIRDFVIIAGRRRVKRDSWVGIRHVIGEVMLSSICFFHMSGLMPATLPLNSILRLAHHACTKI